MKKWYIIALVGDAADYTIVELTREQAMGVWIVANAETIEGSGTGGGMITFISRPIEEKDVYRENGIRYKFQYPDDFNNVISFDTEEQAKSFFKEHRLDLPY